MDDETLQRAIAGDRAAYEQLGRWLNLEIGRSLSRRFSPEVAGELRQRAAIAILHHLDDAPTSVTAFRWWTWSFVQIRILRWYDESKREVRRSVLRAEYAAVAPKQAAMESQFSAQEKWAFFEEAIEKLPAKYRELLWARLVEGLSYREIAARFEVAVGTARSRVMVAKRRVLAKWSQERKTRTDHRTSERAS